MSDLARIVTENGDLIRILIISLFGFLLSIGLTPLWTNAMRLPGRMVPPAGS